jgi:hypothetical protein
MIALRLLSHSPAAAQVESGVGTPVAGNSSAAYFFISKPGEVTMSVNLWGMVRFPGRYEVPISTDLVQLISFAGGPLADADMSSVRVSRSERRQDQIRKVDYTLDLVRISKLDNEALVLRTGDTVYIEPIAFKWSDAFGILTTLAVVVTAVASVIAVSNY